VSLIPAFELGLWNAWIFVVSSLVIQHLISGKYKLRGSEQEMKRLGEEKKKLVNVLSVTMFASLVYSVFLPLKLSTIWFYVGVPVCLVGSVMILVAVVNFATTPVDKPVTKGVFRFSRNPMYFFGFLIYIGVSLACASWLFLLLTVALIILIHVSVVSEETWCLEKYGDAYREYMNRTPRWIGIPKSEKKK
jgi:protein-S-isoprenylcysteine O-methyltransferase Ste14